MKLFKKGLGVFLLSVFVMRCEKPQDILNDLNALFAKEATHFTDLQRFDSSSADVHGEASVHTLNQWGQTLSVIATRLVDLDKKLVKYANDRSKIQASLDVLKGLLTNLLSRDVNYLILSPSWKLREAKNDQQSVANSLAVIRSFALKQFGAIVGNENTLVVSVALDEKLLDTLPDCLQQVQNDFLQYRDSKCSKHFEDVCTHQTVLSCVDTKLKEFRLNAKDCYDQIEIKPDGNSKDAVRESVCRNMQDFLNKQNCFSTLQNAEYYDPKIPGFCSGFKNERNMLSCVIQSKNKVYRKAELDTCAPSLVADETARFRCLERIGSIAETRLEYRLTKVAEITRDQVAKACMSRDPILRK